MQVTLNRIQQTGLQLTAWNRKYDDKIRELETRLRAIGAVAAKIHINKGSVLNLGYDGDGRFFIIQTNGAMLYWTHCKIEQKVVAMQYVIKLIELMANRAEMILQEIQTSLTN
jgi:hypothetical protein